MSAPTIKPGTRCECRNPDCPGSLRERTVGPREACRDDAVRLVTVPNVKMRNGIARESILGPKQVPMCEPCAAHAEKGETR
jgi:hypothetical protein